MRKFTGYFFLALLIVSIIFLGRPGYHVYTTWSADTTRLAETPQGFADDVSRLNRTRISKIVAVDSVEPEKQLIGLVTEAKKTGKKISIAGAKHSMGGHTIYPDGIVINMLPFRKMHLDTSKNILTVGAGAIWTDVLHYLNKFGRSISVMQAYSSFSVGGSLSVNCHGWQHNFEPIAATVQSIRLLTSEGKILSCSRSENQELFSVALGGYGLFGIILDAQINVVSNEIYTYKRFIFPSEQYSDFYKKEVDSRQNAGLVYGRLDITKENFLNETILNVFYTTGNKKDKISPLPERREVSLLRREIFRGSVGNDYGKDLRWIAEKNFGNLMYSEYSTRNQLLYETVEENENRNPAQTEILHEYFIPVKNLKKFITALKKEIPVSRTDLLNITIRNVYEDKTSFLRYAREEVFGFVMLFNQPITPEAETNMEKLTVKLIDITAELGGTYYLPYRLHASRVQFNKIYPDAKKFFLLKKKYDPSEVFQNKFYTAYKN